MFFGWLPLYLPELFPTRVRATGQGVAFNAGRIRAAVGALQMGAMMQTFNGSYAQVGASGYGVVSYLSPYGFNDVALNLENAPMDLEVDTASQRVAPLDGSIVLLRFKAKTLSTCTFNDILVARSQRNGNGPTTRGSAAADIAASA